MSIFDAGRQALAEAASLATEEITVNIGGTEAAVNARVGQKLFKTASGPAEVCIMARRFIVRAADLPAMPGNRDSLTWRGRLFRLGCPDGGPPWRWHGNDNQNVAIYVTDLGTVPKETGNARPVSNNDN